MLSADSLAKIDQELAKYPPERKASGVMAALRIAQEEKGWVSSEIVQFVANYLDMPPIAVQEVATFYNMYDLEPVGRHKLCICTNLPCALSGANEMAAYIKRKLGIDFGETTKDGRFTLKQGECFGACGDAPVVLHNNNQMIGFLTEEKADQVLGEMK
jgi:NADH-quinone oxidoreductase subunit E